MSMQMQLDEQRRRAEADKLAAITELETRSQEFMREKCQKMALEQKIADMQGQMLMGGSSVQVTPAIQCAAPACMLQKLKCLCTGYITLLTSGPVQKHAREGAEEGAERVREPLSGT